MFSMSLFESRPDGLTFSPCRKAKTKNPTSSRKIAIPSHWCRVIAHFRYRCALHPALRSRERALRQHRIDAFRVGLDKPEQGTPGGIGTGASLLPVLNGIQLEAEADR